MKTNSPLNTLSIWIGLFALFPLLGFCPSGICSETISECSFEDSEAEDGTWFGGDDGVTYTETEVFLPNPGNVWTTNTGVRIDTGIVHSGSQSVRLREQDRYIMVDPAGTNGVGTVSFWYTRSSTNAWTCDVQFAIDGMTWNDVLTIPGPADADWHFASVDINFPGFPGNVTVRWYLTQKSTGAIILDDIVITDFPLYTPSTGVEDWSIYD